MNRYHLVVSAGIDFFVYAEDAEEIDGEFVAKALRDDAEQVRVLASRGEVLVDNFVIIDEIEADAPERSGQEV